MKRHINAQEKFDALLFSAYWCQQAETILKKAEKKMNESIKNGHTINDWFGASTSNR